MQRYWWSVMLGMCIACGAYAELEWMGRVYLCPISGQCRDRVYPCPTGGQPQGLSLQTGGKGWFDSLNVRFVGNWPFGPSEAVAFDSARALAFCGSGGGVFILDISTPADPIRISDGVRTRGFVSGLFYDEPNKRLYIAAGEAGLEIWDIADPSAPHKLGSCDTPDYAYGVAVEASYAYIADRDCGLQIYENLLVGVEEDENYELGIMNYELTVYPNPFRGETVIMFTVNGSQFTDKNRQLLTVNCQLKIYDISGRLVQSLVDGKVKPGHHTVSFDGRNLASGIYFARLKAGGYTETRKMILLQ